MSEQLDRSVITIRTIGLSIFFIFLSAVPALITPFLLAESVGVVAAVLIVVVGEILLILAARGLAVWSYNCTSFSVTDEGFVYQRGIFFKQNTTIPYSRIQNIDLYQGPVLSAFNLKSVRIQTAGSTQQLYEASLDGLRPDRAQSLRDELLSKAKSSK